MTNEEDEWLSDFLETAQASARQSQASAEKDYGTKLRLFTPRFERARAYDAEESLARSLATSEALAGQGKFDAASDALDEAFAIAGDLLRNAAPTAAETVGEAVIEEPATETAIGEPATDEYVAEEPAGEIVTEEPAGETTMEYGSENSEATGEEGGETAPADEGSGFVPTDSFSVSVGPDAESVQEESDAGTPPPEEPDQPKKRGRS